MRVFGLIGFPLSHSFSKKYFTEKFEKEKLYNCRYENFPISSIGLLPGILKDNPYLEGLNVTIPYKESVLPFLHDATDEVKEIKACNCIKITRDIFYGFNTDITGFHQSIIKKLKPVHKKALILGTGGAAKAVAYVLKGLNIEFAYVSRNSSGPGFIYNELTEELINEHTLIVNTTPVGVWPDHQLAPPVPYKFITNKHFLFDLIYNPEKTLFLQNGLERGATIQNGMDMLIIQAEESWKIWNQRS
jgi:shikimate dehydrogenase